MAALLNALRPLFELSGLLVILLFFAWAFVTLGSLTDSSTLLRSGRSKPMAGRRGNHAVETINRSRAKPQFKHAA